MIFMGADFVNEVNAMFDEMAKVKFSGWSENFPPLDTLVEEDSGVLRLRFALAGYSKQDLAITFEGDVLILEGGHSKEKGKTPATGYRVLKQGIRQREFSCKYSLPAGKYDTSRVKALFEDGILQLDIPPAENSKPRKVVIE